MTRDNMPRRKRRIYPPCSVVVLNLTFRVTSLWSRSDAFQATPQLTKHPKRTLMAFYSPPSRLFLESVGEFEDLAEGMTSSSLSSSLGSSEIDLSFLPDQGRSMLPQTKDVVTKATRNYIYGSIRNHLSMEDVLSAVEEEYKSFDVPVVVVDQRVDVLKSGEEADESLAEILSLAAIHKLPREITLEILNLQPNATATDDYRAAVSAFQERGWPAVSFPKGLALFPKTMKLRRPRWLRKRKLIRLAQQDVNMASRSVAPPQRLQTREEFLDLMAETLAETTPPRLRRFPDKLLFFPKQRAALERLSLRKAFRKVRRVMDKQAAKLKSQGRAGVLAYAYFNFFF